MYTARMIQGREGVHEEIHSYHHLQNLNHRGGIGEACVVMTSDPKPRLRWTADLHDRFVDAVTQLGGPNSSFSSPLLLLPFSLYVRLFQFCVVHL